MARPTFSRRPSRTAFHPLAVLALFALQPDRTALAASPSAGTISATGPALSWTGTASGSVSANESTCIEGDNCDTFTLTVLGAPADYTGKVIAVKIAWSNSANDYDLYIHKDSNAGTLVGVSANGAPQNGEASAIDPAATGTGVYTVHVVYFAVTPLVDQYQGSASVQLKPVARTASYVQGGITFSPSVRLKAPVARRDGEPSNRTDTAGNAYVTAIRGVPAGVDLWYFDLNPSSPTYDPNMRNPIYRGQTDSFTDSEATSVGGDGGGDVDVAVGLPDPATGANNNPPTLAATSLVLANISAQRSTDRGVTFMKNPAGNVTGGAPVDDRQWIAFFGPNTVYLLYRTVAPAVTQIQRSSPTARRGPPAPSARSAPSTWTRGTARSTSPAARARSAPASRPSWEESRSPIRARRPRPIPAASRTSSSSSRWRRTAPSTWRIPTTTTSSSRTRATRVRPGACRSA